MSIDWDEIFEIRDEWKTLPPEYIPPQRPHAFFDIARIEKSIPPAMQYITTTKHRININWGGRGGTKSHSDARGVLVIAARTPGMRIIVARILKRTIPLTIYLLFYDLLKQYDPNGFFTLHKDRIEAANGSIIFFDGIGDGMNIKGLESADLLWIDEAEGRKKIDTLTEQAFNIIVPTMRKLGSRIWLSYNPYMAGTFLHKLTTSPPARSVCKPINFYDNPHFKNTEMYYDEIADRAFPLKHAHVWLGQPLKEDGSMPFLNMLVKEFNILIARPFFAYLDVAYTATETSDYSALTVLWLVGNELLAMCKSWKGNIDSSLALIDQYKNMFNFAIIVVEVDGGGGKELANRIRTDIRGLTVLIDRQAGRGAKHFRIVDNITPNLNRLTIHPLSDNIDMIKEYHLGIEHDDPADSLSSAIYHATPSKLATLIKKTTKEIYR